MIETLLISVAFCLGWRMVTDEGQLLYFIKKPFKNIVHDLEANEELYLSFKNPVVKNRIKILKIKLYIAKPLILCITCFGSLWGAAVYVTLNGFDVNHIQHLIINSIAASFIQTYIWANYETLINK